MAVEKKSILVVDDTPEDIHFVMENLGDEYAVLVAINGEKALELAQSNPSPDVILMDVEMPGMNGYEACRKIKDNEYTKDINVIFVSSHDTTEEIEKGYDSGGSDYVIKPISPIELLRKIKILVDNNEEKQRLNTEKEKIYHAFNTAITETGELGDVLHFLKNSFSVKELDELALMIVKTLMEGYLLNCTVQIRCLGDTVTLGVDDNIPPLEKELLWRLKDSGRILEHNNRLILNFGDISLLVKNMPKEDKSAYGRLKDNLAILMEGCEVKLKSIVREKELTRLHAQIMENVLQKLDELFVSFGLTENQEKTIINVVEKGIQNTMLDQQ